MPKCLAKLNLANASDVYFYSIIPVGKVTHSVSLFTYVSRTMKALNVRYFDSQVLLGLDPDLVQEVLLRLGVALQDGVGHVEEDAPALAPNLEMSRITFFVQGNLHHISPLP